MIEGLEESMSAGISTVDIVNNKSMMVIPPSQDYKKLLMNEFAQNKSEILIDEDLDEDNSSEEDEEENDHKN